MICESELLQSKVQEEFKNFIASIDLNTIDDVVNFAYEIVIKDDILNCLESSEDYLTRNEIKALNQKNNALQSCYDEWLSNDFGYYDLLKETIKNEAQTTIRLKKDRESR